ncbi:MAG: alpha,alpha-trehalose-phosphate synthase (UDP-forming) [Acidimicrobiales bacterium]
MTSVQHELVIAANRLPVRRTDDGWALSPGGLVTAMAAVMEADGGAWIGWDGEVGGEPLAPFRHDSITLLPFTLDEDEAADYYGGFANSTLWPLYHNALLPIAFKRRWWNAYVRVNQKVAEQCIQTLAPGGVLWVHDYHLQLVPQMVRSARPDARIGFFLHTPFPPSQLMMRLPWRERINEGLLGADLVGFHTVTDAQNFATLVHRLLGLDGAIIAEGHIEVQVPRRLDEAAAAIGADDLASELADLAASSEGERPSSEDEPLRPVAIEALPISIDVDRVEQAATDPAMVEAAARFRTALGNPDVVFLGVDRLDYTKGIDARLKAFRELLRDGALDPERTAFVQVATPSRDDVPGYLEARHAVDQLVGSINGDYAQLGRPVVHYLHQTLPFEELLPLYLAADVMVVTPYEDGMNLVAKEFVACRLDDSGVLVLSEFAGTAAEFDEALLCNPFDTRGLKRALQRAVDLDTSDGRRRMSALRRRLHDHTVHDWAAMFLERL